MPHLSYSLPACLGPSVTTSASHHLVGISALFSTVGYSPNFITKRQRNYRSSRVIRSRTEKNLPSRLVENCISALLPCTISNRHGVTFTNLNTETGDVVTDSQNSEARNQPWNHAYNNRMLEIEVHSNPKHPFKMRKTTEMMGSLQLI